MKNRILRAGTVLTGAAMFCALTACSSSSSSQSPAVSAVPTVTSVAPSSTAPSLTATMDPDDHSGEVLGAWLGSLFNGSKIVWSGDRVVVVTDKMAVSYTSDGTSLVARDLHDGKELWRSPAPISRPTSVVSDGALRVLRVGDSMVITQQGTGQASGLDSAGDVTKVAVIGLSDGKPRGQVQTLAGKLGPEGWSLKPDFGWNFGGGVVLSGGNAAYLVSDNGVVTKLSQDVGGNPIVMRDGKVVNATRRTLATELGKITPQGVSAPNEWAYQVASDRAIHIVAGNTGMSTGATAIQVLDGSLKPVAPVVTCQGADRSVNNPQLRVSVGLTYAATATEIIELKTGKVTCIEGADKAGLAEIVGISDDGSAWIKAGKRIALRLPSGDMSLAGDGLIDDMVPGSGVPVLTTSQQHVFWVWSANGLPDANGSTSTGGSPALGVYVVKK